MKLKAIILWTRFKRLKAHIKTNYRAITWFMYVNLTRLIWNGFVSPLYTRMERRVVNLIESGRVNPQDYAVPMRLSLFTGEPANIEDRYDYSHETTYEL